MITPRVLDPKPGEAILVEGAKVVRLVNLIERSRGEYRCYGVKLQLDNGAEIRCFYGERRPDDVEVSVTPAA